MNKYQEEMDKARQCLIEELKHRERFNRIPTCPHGYRLIDLEDGTCSCDKCQFPKIESEALTMEQIVNPCRNECSLISLDDDHWCCNHCGALFRFVGVRRVYRDEQGRRCTSFELLTSVIGDEGK